MLYVAFDDRGTRVPSLPLLWKRGDAVSKASLAPSDLLHGSSPDPLELARKCLSRLELVEIRRPPLHVPPGLRR